MNQYTYFGLGIILWLSTAVYFFLSREERIEKSIRFNQKVFSTEKLNNTMEIVVDRIKYKINEVKRDLTEDEKMKLLENVAKKNLISNKYKSINANN